MNDTVVTGTTEPQAPSPPAPNSDLEGLAPMDLLAEYNRLKEKGRVLASGNPDVRASLMALDDTDLKRLCAIIQLNRRRSGGQPKESVTKSPRARNARPAAVTEDDLMNV